MSAAEVTMKHSIESQPSKASNKTQPSKTSIESQPSKSDKVSDSKKPASVKRQQKLPSETSDSDDEVFDFDPNFEISASVKRTSSPKTQIETGITTGKQSLENAKKLLENKPDLESLAKSEQAESDLIQESNTKKQTILSSKCHFILSKLNFCYYFLN